jgi:uncharacterized protein
MTGSGPRSGLSSGPDSALYAGTLRHRRLHPRKHEFVYPIFLAFLDIDRLPELMKISPLAGYNRPNLISYQEKDHFGDPSLPLRARVQWDAIQKTEVADWPKDASAPRGKIFLLTHLRSFGYNFNPVSFYYCYDAADRMQSILAEVNNTFGETHNYWLTSAVEHGPGSSSGSSSGPLRGPATRRYRFNKAFHVSPFFEGNQIYDWTFTVPDDKLTVQCANFENDELVFDSTLSLERREWNRHELHRAIRQFPFMTARVIAGIHWQALRLFFKAVPVVSHPGPGLYTRRNTQEIGASWRTR